MKKFLTLFLAVVLIFSSVSFTLVSCTKEKAPEKEEGDTKTPLPEGDIFAERALVDDELEEYDFKGRELRIASFSPSEYFVEEEDRNKGSLMKDAKFNRNETVEKRFNFKITTAFSGTYTEVNDWVQKTVLAGADEFDLFCSQAASAGGLVLKSVFLNWYDIPNVDFSKPWWAKSCADELTYDGKAILAVSDFNSSSISNTFCMLFNKNLANAYDMGNLYEVALNGDWTYEYFYDLIKDIYIDTDGSGTKTVGDFYGFEQSHFYGPHVNSWLYAFDNPTMKKNEEGVPTVAIKTDKINSIVSTIYDLLYNTTGTWYDPESITHNTAFLEKKAIFAVAIIGQPTGEALRNFEDDYGLLPMPKWDKNQKNYTTASLGNQSCLAVPKTVKNTEFVGTCIEALSAESYKTVTPTYYEIALKTRYLRDNESKEVLDIILDSRIYDFGVLYGYFKGFEFCLSGLMYEENDNFESYYDKKKKAVNYHYKNILRAFNKL